MNLNAFLTSSHEGGWWPLVSLCVCLQKNAIGWCIRFTDEQTRFRRPIRIRPQQSRKRKTETSHQLGLCRIALDSTHICVRARKWSNKCLHLIFKKIFRTNLRLPKWNGPRNMFARWFRPGVKQRNAMTMARWGYCRPASIVTDRATVRGWSTGRWTDRRADERFDQSDGWADNCDSGVEVDVDVDRDEYIPMVVVCAWHHGLFVDVDWFAVDAVAVAVDFVDAIAQYFVRCKPIAIGCRPEHRALSYSNDNRMHPYLLLPL